MAKRSNRNGFSLQFVGGAIVIGRNKTKCVKMIGLWHFSITSLGVQRRQTAGGDKRKRIQWIKTAAQSPGGYCSLVAFRYGTQRVRWLLRYKYCKRDCFTATRHYIYVHIWNIAHFCSFGARGCVHRRARVGLSDLSAPCERGTLVSRFGATVVVDDVFAMCPSVD